MTGNRVLFKIKGQIIGVAQNVQVSDDFGLQDVDGLGDVETQEFVVGKITHTITGDKYFVSEKTLRALGFVPTSEEWLTAPEFEVEIQDRIAGATVELYMGCKFATHSRSYQKHAVVGENFTIRCRTKST